MQLNTDDFRELKSFNPEKMSESQLRYVWDHQGKFGPGRDDFVEIKDALSTHDAHVLLPRVISQIVREAVEPRLVGTSLLTRIQWKPGQYITFPTIGSVSAGSVGENEEYPEVNPSIGQGTVVASTGKHGISVSVTEEMISQSQFDIVNMLLKKAGEGLARWKETQIFNYIRAMGVTVFDNLQPGLSSNGVCTGRTIQGNANGSCTMDDVFDTYAQVISQGFMPDTLLMHPLTWVMWVKDATLRAFVQANGGGSFFASWTGNPAGRAPWDAASLGGRGLGGGQNIVPGQTATGATAPHGLAATPLLSYPQTLDSAPTLPSYLNTPLRIVVSPFVYFDPRRKLTDIYLFDSANLGAHLVAEDPYVEQWDVPSRDVRKIKIREQYGFAIFNDGQAIAKMSNVHVVPNEIVLPASANIDVSGGQLAPIPSSTALNI